MPLQTRRRVPTVACKILGEKIPCTRPISVPDHVAVMASVMLFLFLAGGGNWIVSDWLGWYLFR